MSGQSATDGPAARVALQLTVKSPDDEPHTAPGTSDTTSVPTSSSKASPLLQATPATRTPWLPTLQLPAEFSSLRQGACLIYHLMNTPDSLIGLGIFAFMGAVISVSVLSFIAETMPHYRRPDPDEQATRSLAAFSTIDVVCLSIFTVDYFARLFTCVAIPWTDEYPTGNSAETATPPLSLGRRAWRAVGRKAWAFFRSPLNLIDAVAIFPSYVPLFTTSSALGDGSAKKLLILRAVRCVRGIDFCTLISQMLSRAYFL